MSPEQKIALVDAEGENLAVRSFLLQWGSVPGLTVGLMRRHMQLSGWHNMHPRWVDETPTKEHLTKAGAQLWLRFLFDMEDQEPPVPELTDEEFKAQTQQAIDAGFPDLAPCCKKEDRGFNGGCRSCGDPCY